MSGPVTYLDSSALVKLVVREAESKALAAYLPGRRLVSSRVCIIETRRAIGRRLGAPWTAPAEAFEQVALVELDASISERAGGLEPLALRSLDAIHLATALELGPDLDAFVTYDDRQAAAAQAAGMAVMAPAEVPKQSPG